jgi:hypothetical protein
MKEYKVTDKHPAGLTVNDYVYKPGRKFFANEWKWGDDALAAAIKSGRCEMIYDDSQENVKKEKSDDKLESGLEKKKAELEKLQSEYLALDSTTPKAQKILDKIKKLEEELSL